MKVIGILSFLVILVLGAGGKAFSKKRQLSLSRGDSITVREILNCNFLNYSELKHMPKWAERLVRHKDKRWIGKVRRIKDHELALLATKARMQYRYFIGGYGNKAKGLYIVMGPCQCFSLFFYLKDERKVIYYNYKSGPYRLAEMTTTCPSLSEIAADFELPIRTVSGVLVKD